MTKLARKISYSVLAVLAMLCFTFAIIPTIKGAMQTKAAGNKLTVETFETLDGVSVRLDDINGIRFTAIVNEDFYNSVGGADATWGFVINLGGKIKDTGEELTTENFHSYGGALNTQKGMTPIKVESWVSDSWSDAVKAENPGVRL